MAKMTLVTHPPELKKDSQIYRSWMIDGFDVSAPCWKTKTSRIDRTGTPIIEWKKNTKLCRKIRLI